ncbi:hypothetical protein [Hyalangium sp.]|uniref:hypothetical protein n=1 Tax=Hyalangium sp. TaxID=2028555 RepID=UPI002D61541E|nr:hypothetical protein [Hyalangium sp.]HYH97574.1 hypothetical protein [Hyalangium sp.]
MKLAFCVEDDTDEDVFRVLLTRILGTEVTPSETAYRFPRGGWTNALRLAPFIAKDAYNKGLDGALFAIDNDGAASTHSTAHKDGTEGCPLCELRAAARVHEPLSWPRHGLPALRYLFAVPVQTLETWLLLARGYDFKGESETLGRDGSGRAKLKRLLYGVEHPDRDTMRNAALPLAESLDVKALAKVSPSFADFLTQLR